MRTSPKTKPRWGEKPHLRQKSSLCARIKHALYAGAFGQTGSYQGMPSGMPRNASK
jgi:hypothetical protein